jgi:hypothetical protein
MWAAIKIIEYISIEMTALIDSGARIRQRVRLCFQHLHGEHACVFCMHISWSIARSLPFNFNV